MRVGSAARTRSTLATALLGCAGLVALGAALVVRVRWHDDPVMTTLGVILALALGVCGLFYLLVALWMLLTGRAGLSGPDRATSGRQANGQANRQKQLGKAARHPRYPTRPLPGRGRISRWAR